MTFSCGERESSDIQGLRERRKLNYYFNYWIMCVDDYLLLSILHQHQETLSIQLSTYEINIRTRLSGIAMVCFVQEITPIMSVIFRTMTSNNRAFAAFVFFFLTKSRNLIEQWYHYANHNTSSNFLLIYLFMYKREWRNFLADDAFVDDPYELGII